jgi:hypothetical protein
VELTEVVEEYQLMREDKEFLEEIASVDRNSQVGMYHLSASDPRYAWAHNLVKHGYLKPFNVVNDSGTLYVTLTNKTKELLKY